MADSTTVNFFKLAIAALDSRPARTTIVTDRDNFPTDRYVLEGIAGARNLEIRWVDGDADAGPSVADVAAALDDTVALVTLSHASYRSGALADMRAITDAAHGVGALALWDLSHSAGVAPIDLDASRVDLAVGCTYKYLNGGPGAPAFAYVRRDLQPLIRQPIWGWFGQRDQFAMDAGYQPATGIAQQLTGTPAVLGLVAVDEGVKIVEEAGIDAIRAKSTALTDLAVACFDAWLAPLGFALATPRDTAARGGHVGLRHPEGWRLTQALIDANVVPDFRPPDVIRLGFAPLYSRFVDVWDAMDRVRDVTERRAYEQFATTRHRIT